MIRLAPKKHLMNCDVFIEDCECPLQKGSPMDISADGILDALAAQEIHSVEGDIAEIGLPAIRQIEDGKSISSTSVAEVLKALESRTTRCAGRRRNLVTRG